MAREELHQRTVDALMIPTPTMSEKKKAGKKGTEVPKSCRAEPCRMLRRAAPRAIEEMSRRWRRAVRSCGLASMASPRKDCDDLFDFRAAGDFRGGKKGGKGKGKGKGGGKKKAPRKARGVAR